MAETRTLTAHPMHLDFWSHHLLAFAAAFLLAYVTRYIGLPVDASVRIAAIGEIGVLIAVGVPLYTMIVGRMIAARSRQMTLLQSALLGCVIASCLAAALGPSIGWLLGFGIGPFDEAMSRRDYWAALLMAYPASLLLHLTLGTGLWMILCFPWWKREYGDNSEQDLPPAAEVSPVRDANIAPLPSIMHRLPSEVRGTLYALSAERHYVRIYTSNGEHQLLMRLADAVDLARGTEGHRIHRSHWVSRAGVASVHAEAGRMEVRLQNGVSLPVSRSRQGAIRSAFEVSTNAG